MLPKRLKLRSCGSRNAIRATRADSELSRINAAAAKGQSIRVDEETTGLIDFAKACFIKSDGAFDITSGILGDLFWLDVAALTVWFSDRRGRADQERR